MARGRPHGRSKSDHRVCQEARYTRAAEYRERIAISAEQQEARIAAVNAECDLQDAPWERRSQKSSGLKKDAWTARGSAQRGHCKASGNAKKKAKQRLGETLGKAVERDLHSLYCHACSATAEFGLRGSKEGGSVKYSCKAHATSNGCFRVDRDRAAWAEDQEMRRLRAQERRLEEELRQLGGASFTAKPTSAWEESQSTGDWTSVPMSKSLIAALLMMGGIEINPGPTADEIAQLEESWRKADPTIDAPLLDYLAEEALTVARWRGMTDNGRSKLLADLIRDYSGKWYKGWTAILDSAAAPVKRGQDAGAGQSTDVEMPDADQGNQSHARSDILRLQNSAAISETNLELPSGDLLDRAREEERAASKKRKQANLASSPHFVAERLSELFGNLYDKDVGRRMDERANGRVGEIKPGANGLVENIGSRFKLAGYDEFLVDLLNTIAALVERLNSEEVAPQEKIESALHLGRIIAGPGLGKSTVLQESWIHLHKLVTSLSEEDKRRVFEKNPRLLEALRTCLSPKGMLVFHLSFQRPDQGKYHPFERELREQDQDWDRVLALRLLHACLSKEEVEGGKSEKKEGGNEESIRDYELFWETFMEQEKELLKTLSSMKVLDFIRKRAGLADDQHALIVFTFDELEAINHAPKSKDDATIGQHLMSAFARLRQRLHNLQCRRGEHGRTFAISLAASTRASATALSLTASEKAGIVDLHVPIQTYLSLKSISLDLFRRGNIAVHRGNMPGTFKACLRFLGGVPRTLDRLLVALSGGDAIESIRKLDLGELREVLQTGINPKLALRDVLDAYQDETKMRRWKEDKVKREMMESMLAYGLTGEKVFRDGFADSEEKITWQMLESDGFIHLEIEKKEPQVQEARRDSAGSVDLTPGESSAVCGGGGEGASGQAVRVGDASAEAAIEEQRSQGREQGRAGGQRPGARKQGGGAKDGDGASLLVAQAQHRDSVNEGAVSEAIDIDNAEVHGNDPVSRYKRIVALLCGKRKKRRARTQQKYTVQVCPIIFFAGANCSPISRQMWLPIFHAFDIEWRNREETDLQIPMLKLYIYKKFFKRSTVELQQLFPGLRKELARVRIVVPNDGWVRRKDQRKYFKEDMPRLKADATLERDWAHLGPGNYGWDGVYFFVRASEEAGEDSVELAAEEAGGKGVELAAEEAGGGSTELAAEGSDGERLSSQAGGVGSGARESDSGAGGWEAEAPKFQTRVQSKKRVRTSTGSSEKQVTEWAPQKVKASTINWEMDAEENKQGRSDLIVYVTDHRLDSERSELSENITVVDATLMPKYYGPFYYMKDALDAAFHGANRHDE